jgi:hypothetical protein
MKAVSQFSGSRRKGVRSMLDAPNPAGYAPRTLTGVGKEL